MKKTLVREAVEDAISMVDLAVGAAMTEIVEQMTPDLKRLIESKLRGGSAKNEDTDRLRRAKDGYGETEFEEGKQMDKNKKDEMEESLASFFNPVAETADEDADEGMPTEGYEEVDESTFEEGEKCDGDEEEEEGMDEQFEISEEALKEIFDEALQVEAQVKSGFSDLTKGGDFGKDKPDSSGGIADVSSGEKDWAEVDVPAKQDWTVKETVQMIQNGINENKALRKRVAQLEGYCKKLYESAARSTKTLQEVNLFNAKLLHTVKFLNGPVKLTKEQKNVVIERIEKAKTVEEVRATYDTIVETLKATQSLNEGRKPVVNNARTRVSGGTNRQVLSESADATSKNSYWTRIQELSGLLK